MALLPADYLREMYRGLLPGQNGRGLGWTGDDRDATLVCLAAEDVNNWAPHPGEAARFFQSVTWEEPGTQRWEMHLRPQATLADLDRLKEFWRSAGASADFTLQRWVVFDASGFVQHRLVDGLFGYLRQLQAAVNIAGLLLSLQNGYGYERVALRFRGNNDGPAFDEELPAVDVSSALSTDAPLRDTELSQKEATIFVASKTAFPSHHIGVELRTRWSAVRSIDLQDQEIRSLVAHLHQGEVAGFAANDSPRDFVPSFAPNAGSRCDSRLPPGMSESVGTLLYAVERKPHLDITTFAANPLLHAPLWRWEHSPCTRPEHRDELNELRAKWLADTGLSPEDFGKWVKFLQSTPMSAKTVLDPIAAAEAANTAISCVLGEEVAKLIPAQP